MTEREKAFAVQQREYVEKKRDNDRAREYRLPIPDATVTNEIRRLREDIRTTQSSAAKDGKSGTLHPSDYYLTRYRVVLIGAGQADTGSTYDIIRLQETVEREVNGLSFAGYTLTDAIPIVRAVESDSHFTDKAFGTATVGVILVGERRAE